jgi:hypothetical protein
MANYNTSVNYYRINANNTSLATSNLGGTANQPTEEIAPPVPGCTYSSGAGAGPIIGVAITTPASDFNSFAVGQYLYYIDGVTGAYVLMGQIETINSATSVTLSGTSTGSPTAGETLVASKFLVSTVERFYIRVATEIEGSAGTNRANLPLLTQWRAENNLNSVNNQNITKLTRISTVGLPLTAAPTEENIPFTISSQNQFTTGNTRNAATYWANVSDFPNYIWLLAQVVQGQNANALASKTMFRFSTEETVTALNVGLETTLQQLQAAGYNVNYNAN